MLSAKWDDSNLYDLAKLVHKEGVDEDKVMERMQTFAVEQNIVVANPSSPLLLDGIFHLLKEHGIAGSAINMNKKIEKYLKSSPKTVRKIV